MSLSQMPLQPPLLPKLNPTPPKAINFFEEELKMLKAQLVYLETLQCRNIMTKEQIDEERKIVTQKFKLILKLTK